LKINPRVKGASAEREICTILQDRLNAKIHKSYPIPTLKRNVLQCQQGGHDIVGLDWLQIEVKRVEQQTPSLIDSWWAQAVAQSSRVPAALSYPVLIYRKSRSPWRVRVYGSPYGVGTVVLPIDCNLTDWLPAFDAMLLAHYPPPPSEPVV
jgi:hypothetical protein